MAQINVDIAGKKIELTYLASRFNFASSTMIKVTGDG
jgi:hypothetical protein